MAGGYTFGDKTYKLREIIDNCPLPLLVHAAVDRKTTTKLPSSNVSAGQELLLYKECIGRRYEANSLLEESLEDVNNVLVIPDSYNGWFCTLDKLGKPTEVKYRSIRDAALARVDSFLLGDDTKITCFQVQGNGMNDSTFVRRDLFPGELLHALDSLKRTRIVVTRRILGNKEEVIEEMYLKCVDPFDREVVIAYSELGTFISISASGHPTLRQIGDFRESDLPLDLKIAFGSPPSTPCAFTNFVRVTSCSKESSILARTIANKRNIFVELSVDSHLEFRVADLTCEEVQHLFPKEVQMCKNTGDGFLRTIKVKDDDTALLSEQFKAMIDLKPSVKEITRKESKFNSLTGAKQVNRKPMPVPRPRTILDRPRSKSNTDEYASLDKGRSQKTLSLEKDFGGSRESPERPLSVKDMAKGWEASNIF